MNTKELLLTVLVRNGMVVERESIYGDRYNYEKTEIFKTLEIDVESSGEVEDGISILFTDTLNEPEHVKNIKAKVVFTNGEEANYKWELGNMELSQLINLVIESV
jgi:hypothetical protein